MIVTLVNNKILPPKNAKISILSESFQRGYGVFETLRTFNNKNVFKAKEHIERLLRSANGIELKIKNTPKEIANMLQKVVSASPHKLQRLKIIAIKEGIIITSHPLKEAKEIYKKGVSCLSVVCKRSLPEIKSISYLPSMLAHEKATKKGHFDAILIDENQEVYEGAYSNIFWFEDDTLCTRDDQILKGIIRQTILEISPFKIKFKKITLKDLQKKDEVFLTQSVKLIVPIVKIDNKKIGNGKVGERTLQLMQKFKAKSIFK